MQIGEVTPVTEVPGEEVSVGQPDAAGLEEGSIGNLMPFGLVNAPATFQRLMKVVLAGLAREGCLDDILVIGKTWEEHLASLKKVMDRFRAARLRLKPKK